jgi:hypothetical protein
MIFTEAKGSSEAENTEKSKKFRRTARRAIIGLAAIVVLVVLTVALSMRGGGSNQPQQVTGAARQEVKEVRVLPAETTGLPWVSPDNMEDATNWRRIPVPPGGNSEPVPGVLGARVRWGGAGITPHYVYKHGLDCTTCPGDGDVVESYARNNGNSPAIASYAYQKLEDKR